MQSSIFKTRFNQTDDRFRKKLALYLKDPSVENNVHAVRTSVRRLAVMYSLLPKKLRRRGRKQIEKYKEFFKANSRVRDLDVIRAKIAALSSGNQAIDLRLQKKRDAEQAHALKVGKSIRKMRRLRISKVPPSKFDARIDKIADELGIRIKQTLPVVLSDSSKVEQLHRVRKDCKRLRYILESLPSSSARKYEQKVSDAIGKDSNAILLAKIQDMLGEIHDSDITVEHLKTFRSEIAKELAMKESLTRRTLYEEFVRYARTANQAPR